MVLYDLRAESAQRCAVKCARDAILPRLAHSQIAPGPCRERILKEGTPQKIRGVPVPYVHSEATAQFLVIGLWNGVHVVEKQGQ